MHHEHAELCRGGRAIPGVETFLLQSPGFDATLRVSIAQPAAPVLGPPKRRARPGKRRPDLHRQTPHRRLLPWAASRRRHGQHTRFQARSVQLLI
jgi:hypothetical protein